MQALWPALRPAGRPIAVGLAVLAVVFGAEMISAVTIWNTSTAYGHCWLVLPLAGWLLWERRQDALAYSIEPRPVLGLLALPCMVLWLAADLLGIMEGRQLAAVLCVEVLLLAALGPRLFWALSAGFLYLIFLVPFGAFITPTLQGFTAAFVAHGLNFLDIPSQVTSYRIDIPEGTFFVAQACAGLRFLIASIAFGVLYSVTMFRSAARRGAFIAAACVVPVIANGFRALGIVVLGHELGSAQAAATDHVVYGWVFFSFVIVLLALAGMPFRQEPAPVGPKVAPPAPGTGRRAARAIMPVGLIVVPVALVGWVAGSRGAPANAVSVLVAPPGCTVTATQQHKAVLLQSFRCGTARLESRFEILPHRANPARVVEAALIPAAAMVGGGDLDAGQLDLPDSTPRRWLSDSSREAPRQAAATLFIDGAPALGGLHDRMRLTRDLLTGSGTPSAALVVAVTGGTAQPEEALQDFLRAQGDITRRVQQAIR